MQRDCPMSPEELSRYLDGELPLARHRALDAHLAGCRHCRQWLQENREAVKALADLPHHEVPPGLWTAIEARLAASESRFGWWRLLAPMAAAAALALVLMAWPVTKRTTRAETFEEHRGVDVGLLLAALPHGMPEAEEAFGARYNARSVDRREVSDGSGATVFPRERLPGEMRLVSLREFSVEGRAASLLRYAGGGHDMIVVCCPSGVDVRYDAVHCGDCRGGQCRCQVTKTGEWTILRAEGAGARYCLMTTMDSGGLKVCLDALGIRCPPSLVSEDKHETEDWFPMGSQKEDQRGD